MHSENRELVVKTKALIEHTWDEISRLRIEIQAARDTVDQSRKLLSDREPSS